MASWTRGSPADELSSSTYLQDLLDLLQAGDASACDALLQHSLERFRQLA